MVSKGHHRGSVGQQSPSHTLILVSRTRKHMIHIEDWQNWPLQDSVIRISILEGIYLRRNWGEEFKNVAILVAIAVNENGYRVRYLAPPRA